VRNITAAEREAGVISNEDLPWERRDHALYVGYAPFETPRYAVSVVVEHGGGGAAVAAPIARDILLRAQVGDIPPPELYPVSQRRDIEEMHRSLPILEAPPAPSGRASGRPGTGRTGHELSRIQRQNHAHGLAQDPLSELGAGPSARGGGGRSGS
jgi:penicillin-binding protein 2